MDTTNLSSLLKNLISISAFEYMFVNFRMSRLFYRFLSFHCDFKAQIITKMMFIVIDVHHMFPRLFF